MKSERAEHGFEIGSDCVAAWNAVHRADVAKRNGAKKIESCCCW